MPLTRETLAEYRQWTVALLEETPQYSDPAVIAAVDQNWQHLIEEVTKVGIVVDDQFLTGLLIAGQSSIGLHGILAAMLPGHADLITDSMAAVAVAQLRILDRLEAS